MADTQTDELNTSLDTQEEPSQEQKPSETVSIRQLFNLAGQNRIIYDISTNGGSKRTSGWRIHDSSKVEISGSGLGIFNQIILWVEGSPYPQTGITNSSDGRTINFNIEDFNNFFSEGSPVEIQLVDTKNSANNRFLKQKFTYIQESEEVRKQRTGAQGEDREKLQQQEGKDLNTFDPTSLVLDAGGQAMSGVVGGFINNKKTTKVPRTEGEGKTSTVKTAPKSQDNNNEEVESDLDLEESELEDNEAISSTDQEQTGSRIITQGATVTTENSRTISESGTAGVESKIENTVSGTSSRGASLNVSTGGTVTNKVQAENNITSSGTVNGSKQVTSSNNVSTSQKVTGQTSAGGTAEKGMQVGGGKTQTQSQVSSQISTSGTVQNKVDTSQESKEDVTQNAQASLESESKIEKTEQGDFKVDATEEEKITGQENINTNISQSDITADKTKTISQSELNASSYTSLSPSVNVNQGGKPLSPPAGLGAMKTLEVNLNKNLSGSFVGTTGLVASLPSIPSISQNLPTKPKQSEQVNKTNVQLSQSKSLEVEAELPESNIPKESKEGQENLGVPVGNVSPPSKSELSKGEDFKSKPGAEVKGQPIKPGRPLSSLTSPQSEQKGKSLLPTKSQQQEEGLPGKEKFQMPNAPEQEQEQGSSRENFETKTSQESGQVDENQKVDGENTTNQEQEEEQQTPDVGGALQGAEQGAKLGAEFGPEGAVIGGAVGAVVGSGAGEEIVGQTTSKLWWWGLGFSSATFFLGLDFLAGAVIMNVYWWRHRSTPKLFPMKGWQKAVTVFATIFPFFALAFLINLLFAVGCNYPVPAKYSKLVNYKTTVVGAFIGENCKYFDIDNYTTQAPAGVESNTAQPNGSGVNPRGVAP